MGILHPAAVCKGEPRLYAMHVILTRDTKGRSGTKTFVSMGRAEI